MKLPGRLERNSVARLRTVPNGKRRNVTNVVTVVHLARDLVPAGVISHRRERDLVRFVPSELLLLRAKDCRNLYAHGGPHNLRGRHASRFSKRCVPVISLALYARVVSFKAYVRVRVRARERSEALSSCFNTGATSTV